MKKLAILFLAAAFIVAMYVPVSAADWGFYGHARVNTFWINDSEERSGWDDDVTELDHDLQGNARIGANVDAGNIGGRFEYGHSDTANLRLLYATVDLGAGELEVGKDYSPYSWAGLGVSTQVTNNRVDDANMLHSVAYVGRNPMVQYEINDFRVALVSPDENVPGEVMLPRLEAYYSVPMEGMSMGFAGMYQTYDLDDNDAGESGGGDSLDVYGIGAKFNFNMMDPVYFNLAGSYAINPSMAGQYLLVDGGPSLNVNTGEVVEDTSVWNATAVVGVALANGIRLETGAGFAAAENDEWAEDDEAMVVYGQANIPIGGDGNAFIVPEIGFIDYKDDSAGDEEGDVTYAGLKWQINF